MSLQDLKRRYEDDDIHEEVSRPRKRPDGASSISRAEAEAAERQKQKMAAEAAIANSKTQTGAGELDRQDGATISSQGQKRRRKEDDTHEEVSRPRKRPGGASRISRAEAEAAEQLKQNRAAEAAAANPTVQGGVGEAVRQHYNAVPERGRDWRKTDSKIKGLRSFNNWIKSTVIHKFSPGEADSGPLKVLDIGCGKGGDLQKWQRAPHPVELYIGIDAAEVSIDQARERYRQMRSRGSGGRGGRGGYHRSQRLFDAEFLAEDAFSFSLGDLRIVREVGFGPGSRWGPAGGFDVVSMMFCMHYAFENEAKAKGMLNNVAGSLKKGGRFFGVIPNSDVLRDGVTNFHKGRSKATLDRANPEPKDAEMKCKDGCDRSATPPINGLMESSPESRLPSTNNKKTEGRNGDEHVAQQKSVAPESDGTSEDTTAEWGNSIYRVRFPGETPKDGIFRPPYGWKYSYFMEEAVEEVPEYIVPWEAFRAIAEDYNLELQYRRPFAEVWQEEKNSPVFGPLSEQMGVRGRDAGPLLITDEEFEAASFYHAFCFYKV